MIKDPSAQIEVLLLCADLFEYPENGYNEVLGQLSGIVQDSDCVSFDSPQEELEAEYLQIFSIGASSKKTVLNGGWWSDGRLYGAAYRRIERFYTECGYALDPDMLLPADHLSVMLRFLSVLLEDGEIENAREFSRSLTWLDDLERALENISAHCAYTLATRSIKSIINAIK